MAHKRLRSQQNYINQINNFNAIVGQHSSVTSGGGQLHDDQRRDLMLKNAKSLGNSLGTNKKTLNMSHANPGLIGIDRDSTLNDGQYYTLAKTGLLNNLNLT